VDENKVHIVFPDVNSTSKIEETDIKVNRTFFNMFYPASNQFFKNHWVIFQALKLIDNKLNHKIVLYLTNKESEFNPMPEFRNIEIVFLGKVPFQTVMSLYQQVDCLVFPSYIETLGLPLIEAASTGLSVLAADLPYAHEVLNGYGGVKFIDVHHIGQWANAIFTLASENKKIKFEKFVPEKRNSWPEFFEILKNKRYV
jgi:glycosyltransferase involved in cell wall biosynthesis